MNSANGRIPAGSISVPITSFCFIDDQHFTSPIEKCPDRSANISFSICGSVLKSLGEPTAKNSNSFSTTNLRRSQY